MNTYSVTYFPPSTTTPATVAQQAASYDIDEAFVLFLDDSNPAQVVLAVPLALNPVIQRTAAA